MYAPAAFAETDGERLAAIIRGNGFGLLVSRSGDGPAATHVPFLMDEAGGTLAAHVAKANPQWRGIDEAGPVLAVFSGSHGYVSPRWYRTRTAVPTWNYEAVHVTGRARAVHDPDALRSIVDRLSRVYEAGADEPWSVDGMPPEMLDRMLKGIVGIEIAIDRIEGVRKLSQNKPEADRQGVVTALEGQGDGVSMALAAAMKDFL